MPNFDLLDLATVLRRVGRGVIMYGHDGAGAPVRWDGVSVLNLAHLGDTEGDITFNPNEATADFTLPEISGEAVYESDRLGGSPTLEIPIYLADPALLPIISASGAASDGFGRVAPVEERTIVVFPERLFKNPTNRLYGRIVHTAGVGFEFSPKLADGSFDAPQALTAAQETLLALSVWIPRGKFTKPPRRFRGGHGNDGKNIEAATFTAMMHPAMPDGARLYWEGAPEDFGIDINPTS